MNIKLYSVYFNKTGKVTFSARVRKFDEAKFFVKKSI